jgi:hypothetical protein
MKFVKSPKEYEKLKKGFSKKIDKFLKDYMDFLNYTSPDYWRSGIYSNIKKYKDQIESFQPLTMKELENEWNRDQVFNDEQKEYWNTLKKYNI